MVNIKFAVNRAKSYLMEFFPEKKDSIRLEETELDENGEQRGLVCSCRMRGPVLRRGAICTVVNG